MILRATHQGKKRPTLLMAVLDLAAELRGCRQVARVVAEQVGLAAEVQGCRQVARVAAVQVGLAAGLRGCRQAERVVAELVGSVD